MKDETVTCILEHVLCRTYMVGKKSWTVPEILGQLEPMYDKDTHTDLQDLYQ